MADGYVLIAQRAQRLVRSRPGPSRFPLAPIEVPCGQMHLLSTATGHTLCCTQEHTSLCCGGTFESFDGRSLPDRIGGGCPRCRALNAAATAV